ncbi:type IV secretion system DNA-binding domain-containing protein [Cellvibrio sp.]|uniref:type IV secretion system DNA-binding domain-containing protein n=1 Tax=Cellvibrio sp. TaxID=1965322 RepID=UPI00396486FB
MTQNFFLEWVAGLNYSLMAIMNNWYWQSASIIFFIGSLIGMTPLKYDKDHLFHQLLFIYIRKALLGLFFLLLLAPPISGFLYEITGTDASLNTTTAYWDWFTHLANRHFYFVAVACLSGWLLRFSFSRYALPLYSSVLRKISNKRTSDELSDIRKESSRLRAKDYLPEKHYKPGFIFVGLNEHNGPNLIPIDLWREANMQIIGPTRYGKGVIIGNILDQIIRQDDCVFYIDPKKDAFAPHIMYQAAKLNNRKFYYVALHDDDIGSWAPFAGGSDGDALVRAEIAFGLEFTGDPGTDYYKSQELKEFQKAFAQTRNIESLKNLLKETDANRINAELARWSRVKSLVPKNGSGFSIQKAIKENAVVYIQGHLKDAVLRTATKIFIVELVQEAMNMHKERKNHLTVAIDEVSFLVSKDLAQSLATSLGFNINFVLAYQSQNDLLNLDDNSVNGNYIHQSINVNCQLKAVYGGADFETAEWASNLSGTIIKEVTKMERAEISKAGGEIWEGTRSVGSVEENFINKNTILTLPPRVCVFIQPRKIASINYTAFVPVKDTSSLETYIEHKKQIYSSRKSDTLEPPSLKENINPIKQNENPQQKNFKKHIQQLPKKNATQKNNRQEKSDERTLDNIVSLIENRKNMMTADQDKNETENSLP